MISRFCSRYLFFIIDCMFEQDSEEEEEEEKLLFILG